MTARISELCDRAAPKQPFKVRIGHDRAELFQAWSRGTCRMRRISSVCIRVRSGQPFGSGRNRSDDAGRRTRRVCPARMGCATPHRVRAPPGQRGDVAPAKGSGTPDVGLGSVQDYVVDSEQHHTHLDSVRRKRAGGLPRLAAFCLSCSAAKLLQQN